MMPLLKIPAKSKYITIEFLIDPAVDGEHVIADIFETVIIPVSVYISVYNQLVRANKLAVLSGAKHKQVTAKNFYAALKQRHKDYDKAIGYHTFL